MMSHSAFELLKERKFYSLSYEEKRLILDHGRPTPNMDLSKENKRCTRKFNSKLYEDIPWLCGNLSNRKLYCWPCVLFSKENSVWNTITRGYDDLNNLHTSISRHEQSRAHLNAFIDFKTFGKTRIDLVLNKQKSDAISRHNEEVSNNREILKRLIRITCFLGMQELAFRGHKEGENAENRGNYIELAYCMGEFDEKLQKHLKTATVFKGTSSAIQNGIIESISAVILEKIKNELNECMYVAILLDETSDVSCFSQLSTVLRYVNKHGDVCERFIKFNDVSNDRCASAIADLSLAQLRELGCLEKLVAQSYDGAAVMGSDLNGVQAKIREDVPEAIFIHCYAHKLNLVLSQAVSVIRECNDFFSVLGSLSSFFSSSTKRTSMLDSIVGKRFPKLAPTRWNYSSRLVETVKENKEDIIDLLKSILESPRKFDERTKNSARGLLAALDTFDFHFLLEVFSSFFPLTEFLFSVLQTKSMDIVYCLFMVESTMQKIKQIRDAKFEEIWTFVTENYGEPVCKRKQTLSPKEKYSQEFHEIFDSILLQLEARFGSMEKLEFIELLDCNKFKKYDVNFPVKAFESLKKSYSVFFEFSRLRSELSVLYSHEQFAKKNVAELLKHMLESDLHIGLPEIYKLMNLVMTIPITTASVERSFSALKRIKSYLRSSQSEERLSNLSLISIERHFLKDLMADREKFYGLVIEEFCKKTRRVEFLFK